MVYFYLFHCAHKFIQNFLYGYDVFIWMYTLLLSLQFYSYVCIISHFTFIFIPLFMRVWHSHFTSFGFRFDIHAFSPLFYSQSYLRFPCRLRINSAISKCNSQTLYNNHTIYETHISTEEVTREKLIGAFPKRLTHIVQFQEKDASNGIVKTLNFARQSYGASEQYVYPRCVYRYIAAHMAR